ncbi:hypothetical protein M407DRAFT_245459 [Tulasnella calospora MUT 4182]|uniref:Uncharacterized protein n=1 Tax=Tulasnella calospora MUT 4182 TaxID=1051891 RepID=A0A0C3Q9U8_9AGAM|nr:hypothetical protein M407DRAFT_245459 [Tulasnella calospora MUT 4182]
MLQALALDPLHIEPRAMEPVAQYLAQLCPTVNTFDCVLLHPRETGTVDVDLDSFSEDETRNVAEMENLFFYFQEGDGIWESASQEPSPHL